MRIVRKKAFETNSSSCHSLTYVKSDNPLSYLEEWKQECNLRKLVITLRGYYEQPNAYRVEDKLSYIFSDFLNGKEDEFVTTEHNDDCYNGGFSQSYINAFSSGAFSKHTIHKDVLDELIKKEPKLVRLIKLLKKHGFELEFTVKGSGWIGVDHESQGLGRSIMNYTDDQILEFLFNHNNYFELGAC